jgi:UDP-N-acetylmuramate dehydrogenase
VSRSLFEHLAASIGPRFSGQVETGRSLARLTTYRLGGPAGLYVEPADVDDLKVLGEALRVIADERGPVPVLTLGRGSNIVISDRGFPGVVVRLRARSFAAIESSGEAGLRAGAATSLPLLANWAARRALAGIEFLIAIPGSVGGAVRMNAGAHGGEIKDVLATATIFGLDDLEVTSMAAADVGFAYRSSTLTERDVVLDASLVLTASDGASVRDRMEDYRRHRAATQPPAVQNAGSTFKNPSGDHAGRLVEAAGLKGARVGGAAVSALHANFFVTDEGASAQDVYDLVQLVRERVGREFGIDLEPEVRFVGAFEDPARAREVVP